MKKKVFAVAMSLMLLLLMAPQTVLACAFDTLPYFTYSNHPDLPLQPYAKGNLGIVDGSFARSYLFTAYRYFEDKPLTADEQQAVVNLWNTRLATSDWGCGADTSPWLKARMTVPGAVKIDTISTEKSISNDETWQYFCNCQTDAFSTATQTLQTLSTKYGIGSQQVKDWLKAQDEVFSNCGDPPYGEKKPVKTIPDGLPATADAALQQQRAYQIAAANFYAQHYDVAREQFLKIAADSASPWANVAGYLAARCLIRQASLAKTMNVPMLKQADEELVKLAALPAYAGLKEAIKDLQNYISARVAPEDYLRRLVTEAYTADTLGELTKVIDNLAGSNDGEDAVAYTKLPAVLKTTPAVDWVMTFQSNEKAAVAHAIDEWKKTKSVPWLVAAAAGVEPADPNADAIVAVASSANSPAAKWTLFYNVNRIKLGKGGKDAEVREALDKVLNAPPADLPVGSLNELRTQRLPLSRNLAEFLRFGVQKPLTVASNGGTEGVPDDIDNIIKTGRPEATQPMFTPEAAVVMSNNLPVSVLTQIAQNTTLPNNLRNNVAWTTWVRAILVGDDASAKTLAPIVKLLNPKKAGLVAAYMAASSPEDRKFAAVNLMMHFSSAVPNVTWGPLMEDGYGDDSGWWWSSNPVVSSITTDYGGSDVGGFDPQFLTPAQKAQAKAQIAKLGKVEEAPNYFAKVVLPYAKAHPADPRVPEALHWFVKSTRYGMTNDDTKAYSKEAFTLLHTKYKGNAWTKKTPYYY